MEEMTNKQWCTEGYRISYPGSHVLSGHVDQVRELLHVLFPPHQGVRVKGHLMYSRVDI
jgi:hypothetical protein